MYAKRCLGQPNVSCLSRSPYFRGVLNEGFHCIGVTTTTQTQMYTRAM